MGEFLS